MTLTDWAGTAAAFGVLLLVWWPIRLAIAQATERRFDAAYRRDRDGIILGAEPIYVRGVRPGAVLLLHGYNDSPQAMASLAGALHDAGWTVHVPLLPGHGRTLQAFAASGAAQWIQAARDALHMLRARHEHVATCGLSMGGAIAMLLADEHPDVRACVGIAPYLHLSRSMRLVLSLSPIAALGARYISGGGGKSIHDSEAAARMISYRASTPRLLGELARVAGQAFEDLPGVAQPVLVIQSREDNRIPPRLAHEAFDRIGSRDKTLVWTSGAGHVITVDFGHAEVERTIVEWLSARLD